MRLEHTCSTRIRYGETDQMGVVYHGNYAQFLEMGRTELLRNIGVSYKSMEEEGVMLPVVSLTINYKKSAYYDDVIFIKTILSQTPSVKITFDYEITNELGELLTTATVVLAFMNKDTHKLTRCPDYVLNKLG
ncbi:acyl-CoA thioesterase [Neptunitalea lumnitzerae]|uniref:Thioesterase n=1 Tax=Neptunitalea lumnitzerae TaxID=2965509 RepID=A0ABQ5ML20_9FLAO|nr:thioesterase family protein [Neptunitalea sp. Y10]GLB49760.1 thioesterase [Neptunitalea sp. Y10]